MRPSELAAHLRRKTHQVQDAFFSGTRFSKVQDIGPGRTFPVLPKPSQAPEELRAALRRDAADILAGRWIAFGYLPLQVDDPPLWQKDYLVGIDMATRQRALKLHHRLEGKADIKLIWEPSRWYSLVRLAQAAYLLEDQAAANTCVRLLDDWARQNTPYFGWHWTSGLESGIRLIQFAWIDALLEGMIRSRSGSSSGAGSADDLAAKLRQVRAAILPPHLWFTWRERSFGSSANNHVLGEFAGLILALVRWPELSRWAVPLETIQPLWEEQVLTQFAPDGGNREQALNYHLFGWEFCWQARLALKAAGRNVAPEVEDRLRAAVGFFSSVQTRADQWDYGDSDNAFVTPLFVEWDKATTEWHGWFEQAAHSPGISYWLGDPPKSLTSSAVVTGPKGWRVFPETGIATCKAGDWFLRLDISPLGFLSTAGHGHCDALHLSIWYGGKALVIDPGTAAYHADRPVRDYLASWEAHNAPHPAGLAQPKRMGTFLWSEHHDRPSWKLEPDGSISAELVLKAGVMRRRIAPGANRDGWDIEDQFAPSAGAQLGPIQVLWQFAPGLHIATADNRAYKIEGADASVLCQLGDGWERATLGSTDAIATASRQPDLKGTCAPLFRKTVRAPFLSLESSAASKVTLRTSFLRG